MFKKLILGFLTAFFVFVAHDSLTAKVIDRTLGIVNDEAIMQSEFNEIINPVLEEYNRSMPAGEKTPEKIKELKSKVFEQMVNDRLVKQEAKKQKIKVSKRELENGIAQVKTRFPTEADFAAELKKGNLTMPQFEKRIEEQLMMMKLLEQEIQAKATPPQEGQIKDFFEKIQKKMDGKNLGLGERDEQEIAYLADLFKKAGAEKVKAKHIFVRADQKATQAEKANALKKIRDVKKKIDGGEDFEELAKKYSEDPGTRENGGDLNYFTYEDMNPEFSKAAFATPVGGVSNPVLSEFGYHLIKVEEKRAKRKITLDDVKNDIKEFLTQKEAQRYYEGWIKNIRAKSSIKINELE